MIFELGQKIKLCPHSYIICQMIFFLNFICFHVLHNVRHKIATIFMMLKTFSCADLFSRLLCWSIYWWMMWFLCGFEYIAKNHHRIYRDSDWNLCWMSGKSQIFFCQPCGNPAFVLCAFYLESSLTMMFLTQCSACDYAVPSAKYTWFCWWTQEYEWHL